MREHKERIFGYKDNKTKEIMSKILTLPRRCDNISGVLFF